MDMNTNWEDRSSKEVYNNPWISVSEHQVITPTGKGAVYGKVHYKKRTVACIPVFDDNQIMLVGQNRFPTQSYSWEIPMGGAGNDESLLEAAKRELQEETGLISKEWKELIILETSNSVTDEVAHVFYCTDTTYHKNAPDETECITLKVVDLNEACAMAMNGTIKDAISVAAILKLHYIFNQ